VYISEFSISNHKSFNSPVQLTLKPGVNLIVGKNNSGKSALLEALSMSVAPVPHRSFQHGEELSGTDIPGAAEARFVVTAAELAEIVVPQQAPRLPQPVKASVPLPNPDSDFARSIAYVDKSEPSLLRFSRWLKTADLELSIKMNGQAAGAVTLTGPPGYTSATAGLE